MNNEKIKDYQNKNILIIEDEPEISELLVFNLQREGYKTIVASDGEEGIQLALSEEPDVILLDVMLPKADGLTVCRKIRPILTNTPIIMISAKSEEIDKILGLEIGADDYITKPFSVREVIARIKANLRKISSSPKTKNIDENGVSNEIKIKDIKLDLNKYEVTVRGQVISNIPRKEFEVLKYLALRPGQIVSRIEFLQNVWQYDYLGDGDIRTVDVTVRRLREKIERNPKNPKIVITKRGRGYYIEPR